MDDLHCQAVILVPRPDGADDNDGDGNGGNDADGNGGGNGGGSGDQKTQMRNRLPRLIVHHENLALTAGESRLAQIRSRIEKSTDWDCISPLESILATARCAPTVRDHVIIRHVSPHYISQVSRAARRALASRTASRCV